MTMLEVLTVPDKRLKTVSEPIETFDRALLDFVADLEETMLAGAGRVGIAAAQVGYFKRIVIVDVSSKPKIKNHGKMILVNPEITAWEGMVKGREGCMSVPDYTGNVIRAKKINLSAFDQFGNKKNYECEDYEARAIQHEVDHLDGIVFLDRLVSRRTDLFRRKVYLDQKN